MFDPFPKMVPILKEQEGETFALQHFTVTKADVEDVQLIDRIHGRGEYDGFKPGQYVRLVNKSKSQCSDKDILMSDTWMEKQSNLDLYHNAKGAVLIGGLGLGMVLLAIQDKPEVSSILVVEKEQEIINLVKPQLPLNSKVTIIHGDIFTYTPTQRFDTIYFDIWSNLCSDHWEEMKKLSIKFRSRLNKGGWMSSWRKEDTRYLLRIGY
ncbi:hypothetical protein MUP77_10725 [Candidatus Bathyarchaeota archaeon]|nr:hypothetical protein [Candidatus Bathyarchaeota archaeon]